MKPGKTSIYLSEKTANLLAEHGPDDEGGNRSLAEKLNYILPAWDGILREEKAKWTKIITREEWAAIQIATWSHMFSMEQGGAWELDARHSILHCVEDTDACELLQAIDEADMARVRASLSEKLRGASTAAQLALAWMVIRERKRSSK